MLKRHEIQVLRRAEFLGVTPFSVINWEKHGMTPPTATMGRNRLVTLALNHPLKRVNSSVFPVAVQYTNAIERRTSTLRVERRARINACAQTHRHSFGARFTRLR